jgi:hypothetical protein
MPTRRAVRPDSRHHREARRQRITHVGGQRGARIVWAIVVGIAALGLIVAIVLAIFGKGHGSGPLWMVYSCAGALLVAIGAMLFSR